MRSANPLLRLFSPSPARLLLAPIILAVCALPLAPRTSPHASTAPPTYAGVILEDAYITMSDGVRLAVTLYKPIGASHSDRFPAILEYLPYRKDDWAAGRDYTLHSYFVRRGYVSARVDIRGTGASEGLPPEREYSKQEQKDGMEVIAWLARQPWCNGSVGMIGISWGGFNAIQMATRRPPALKAIIGVDATEQLFHDDIHYIDGIMHADEYELGMDEELEMTAAPNFPTDEAHLAPRFDSTPWFLLYLHHQRDSDFWKEPLQQPVYDSIQIPVYLIGGFYDGYRDTIPRMLTQLKGPFKALLGPWNHTFPHDAEPGPAIEWRDTAVRWWDRWLKGTRNGIESEPKLTVYMQHWYAPNPSQAVIPGEWRNEDSLLPDKEIILYLASNHSLSTGPPGAEPPNQLRYVPTAGVEAGFWWGDLANDQRGVDAFSLVYDSMPLAKDTAILGLPHVELNASSTAPLADWIVRLSDVAPDGSVTLITGGALNGAQRESATEPSDLQPGTVYPLQVEMHITSWIFPRRHRIRLAVSNALWPMLWPTPSPMTTALAIGGPQASRLTLPEVSAIAAKPVAFANPTEIMNRPGYTGGGDDWPGHWEMTRDEVTHTSKVFWREDAWGKYPWGRIDYHEDMTFETSDDHSDLNLVRGYASNKVKLKNRELDFQSTLELRSDVTNFYYSYRRDLTENAKLIRTKTWKETIPRDHQ